MTIFNLVEDHYLSRFGKPDRTATFRPEGGPIMNVWKWDESKTQLGVAIYATIGASEVFELDGHRCEFLTGLKPSQDGIASALAEVGLHGSGRGTLPPKYGDTVTLVEPLWPGTRARSFLFLQSSSKFVSPLVLDHNTTVDFIQVIHLLPEEIEYKKQFGEKALWKKFEQENTEYWNPDRG